MVVVIINVSERYSETASKIKKVAKTFDDATPISVLFKWIDKHPNAIGNVDILKLEEE